MYWGWLLDCAWVSVKCRLLVLCRVVYGRTRRIGGIRFVPGWPYIGDI